MPGVAEVRGRKRAKWSRWSRWCRMAGRVLFEGLIAAGCCNGSGFMPPTEAHLLCRRYEEETQRALWAQLREVHRLLPLLDAPPGEGASGERGRAGGPR